MVIPYFKGTLEERMEKLNRVLSGKKNIRLVGSSFGGLMASIFAMGNEANVKKIILLAPAINMIESTSCDIQKISIPAWIYHGKQDEVIPLKDVENTAEKMFDKFIFKSVDDDHFLHKTFKTIDWETLLS